MPRIARVVDVPAVDEIGDDLTGYLGWRAAAPQPRSQLRAGPRAAREQVARREAGGPDVENRAGRYDFSGAGALRPNVSRIFCSSSNSAAWFSCSHFLAFSRP